MDLVLDTVEFINKEEMIKEIEEIDLTSMKPYLLLLGEKGSGKTSIIKSVFDSFSRQDCNFITYSKHIKQYKINYSAFLQFNIIDVPSNFNLIEYSDHIEKLITKTSLILFITEMNNANDETINFIKKNLIIANKINNSIIFEIFIHKSDKIKDYFNGRLNIYDYFKSEFANIVTGPNNKHPNIRFHTTALYDYSLYEALSKCIHHIIPQFPFLNKLLTIATECCHFEKVFLFDSKTKLYLASDINPFDSLIYELFCDMLGITDDFSYFYDKDVIFSDGNCSENKNYFYVTLENKKTLYLVEIDKYLVLVCLIPNSVYENKAFFNYNLNVIINGVIKMMPSKEFHKTLKLDEIEKLLK